MGYKITKYYRSHHNCTGHSESFNKISALALVKYCDTITHDGLYPAVSSLPRITYMKMMPDTNLSINE